MDSRERPAPYPTLLPFQVFDYPIAHLMRNQGPVSPESWPPRMNPRVAAWKERTAHLPEGGNLLYIHVPFCPFICHFCFLYKSRKASDRVPERREQFVDALLRHIAMVARRYRYDGTPFTTVYFGGGTPTELTPAQLGRILQALRGAFPIADDAELTLEAVANRTLYERFDDYFAQGFNRLSFGVQSLDPAVRRRIGRGEKVEDYERLIELLAQRAGVPFNVDLMVGLPGQTIEGFADDVRRVVSWGIGSLDVYTYWMVPGTRMFDSVVREGRNEGPSYGTRLVEYRAEAKRLMRELGFRPVATEAYVRTDINNFMKSTFGGGGNALSTSLAFGPSAFGFVNGTLYRDVPDFAQYLSMVDRGLLPFQCSETLDLDTSLRRAMLMGIQRLNIPRIVVEQKHAWRKLAVRWSRLGLVRETPDSYDLTDWGAVWFNQMQLEVVPLAERLRMSSMLGTASDQLKALARPAGEQDELAREFTLAVRNGNGFGGGARMTAYKGLLQLRRLRVLEDQAYNFAGRVEQQRGDDRGA